MTTHRISVGMTHPPYNTRTTSGPAVKNPLPEHVDLAFKYTKEFGCGEIGAIWINWNVKDQQGNVLDHREMHFAVSREHDCCFAVRMKERKGYYENLIWSHGPGSEEIITIGDAGGGEWRFKAASKLPMADAIALAKRFVAEGYIGDDLEWKVSPEEPKMR